MGREREREMVREECKTWFPAKSSAVELSEASSVNLKMLTVSSLEPRLFASCKSSTYFH